MNGGTNIVTVYSAGSQGDIAPVSTIGTTAAQSPTTWPVVSAKIGQRSEFIVLALRANYGLHLVATARKST